MKASMARVSGVLCLQLATAALGATTLPALEPTVLILCDNTPGTILLSNAMRDARLRDGQVVSISTPATQFSSKIAERDWEHIIVCMNHGTDRQPILNALIDRAQGGARVEFLLWRAPAGVSLTADQPVLVSTLQVVWSNDQMTQIVLMRSGMISTSGAQTIAGYSIPSFEDSEVAEPAPVPESELSPLASGVYSQSGPSTVAADPPQNEQDCFLLLVQRISDGIQHLQADSIDCLSLYGPRPHDIPPFPGDPAELRDCLEDVTEHYVGTVAYAYRQYRNCTVRVRPTSQPASP